MSHAKSSPQCLCRCSLAAPAEMRRRLSTSTATAVLSLPFVGVLFPELCFSPRSWPARVDDLCAGTRQPVVFAPVCLEHCCHGDFCLCFGASYLLLRLFPCSCFVFPSHSILPNRLIPCLLLLIASSIPANCFVFPFVCLPRAHFLTKSCDLCHSNCLKLRGVFPEEPLYVLKSVWIPYLPSLSSLTLSLMV